MGCADQALSRCPWEAFGRQDVVQVQLTLSEGEQSTEEGWAASPTEERWEPSMKERKCPSGQQGQPSPRIRHSGHGGKSLLPVLLQVSRQCVSDCPSTSGSTRTDWIHQSGVTGDRPETATRALSTYAAQLYLKTG